MRAYIGIDPGAKGAAALVTDDNSFVDYIDFTRTMDVIPRLRNWCSEYDIKICALEEVSSRPGQSCVATFTFGVNYGWWRAVLECHGLPYTTVRPQVWQKGIPGAKEKDKISRKVAIAQYIEQIVPSSVVYGPRGGLLDGRADATGLALWARRQLLQ